MDESIYEGLDTNDTNGGRRVYENVLNDVSISRFVNVLKKRFSTGRNRTISIISSNAS